MAEISYDNTEYTRGMQDAINDLKRAIEKKKSSDDGEKKNGESKMGPDSDDENQKSGRSKSDNGNQKSGGSNKSKDGKLSADDAVNKVEGGNDGQDSQGGQQDSQGGQEGKGGQQGNKPGQPGQEGGQDSQEGQDGQPSQEGGQDGQESGQDNQDGPDGKNGGNPGKDYHKGDSDFIAKLKDDLGKMTDEEVAKYEEYSKNKIKDTLTEARNNGVDGMLYDFFKKCSGCATTIHGMRVMTRESGAGWFEKLDKIIDRYIKQKITRQPKVYKRTFSRIARRPAINPDIINKGKLEKKNQIQLKVAFYMDCSYSMSSHDRYKNVVIAANTIADNMDEAYKKSEIIQVDKEKSFMFYKFDRDWNNDRIEQMDRGDLNMPLGGGTPSAASLINHISEGVNGYEGKDAVVNVIMTDGYMDGAENAMAEALNKYPNFMFIFITCDFQADIKRMALSGAYSNLSYIQSDEKFNLKGE